MRTIALTVLALVAFAANSILGRLALRDGRIDPASYSTVRFASGALALWLIATVLMRKSAVDCRGSWRSAGPLFLYAVPFSFAYVSLDAGTGALLLFGAVQATMILSALRSGERPSALEWLGLVVALGGLVYLVSPGVTAPSPTGSTLMIVAGVAWGVYSLQGRAATDPVAATTGNFVRTVPLVVAVNLVAIGDLHVTAPGALFAVSSGALASGVGYVIWYAALSGLTATRAATVQLSVPVIAAAGGVLFLSEEIGPRLLLSSALILGGVALAISSRQR